MSTPEDSQPKIEIPDSEVRIKVPDFVGRELKTQIDLLLPDTIKDVKLRIQNTVDGFISNGFGTENINLGLEHYTTWQKSISTVFNNIDKHISRTEQYSSNQELIEEKLLDLGVDAFLDYLLRRKSRKVDYSNLPKKSYDHFIFFLESLRKYSLRHDFNEIEVETNSNGDMSIEHAIKLLINAVIENGSVESSKVLISLFFVLCYSEKVKAVIDNITQDYQEQDPHEKESEPEDKKKIVTKLRSGNKKEALEQVLDLLEEIEQEQFLDDLSSGLESKENNQNMSEAKVFFVLGRLFLENARYSEEDMIRLIVAKGYFGLDTEGIPDLKNYPGSALENKLLKLEESKHKPLGRLCLTYFRFFKGKNTIHFDSFYKYLEENYEDKKEQVDNFLGECDFLYKLTEEEIVFILQNNLESNQISSSKESIQICNRLVERGFLGEQVIELGIEKLQYIDKRADVSNEELLELISGSEGNFEDTTKVQGEIKKLEEDMKYLPTNHSSRERLGALVSSVDANTQVHEIVSGIERIDRDFGQGAIINFHKNLMGGNIDGMKLLNFVYEKYPKPKKSERRAYKEEVRKTLESIFNKDVRKQEIISQVIEKYGNDIAEEKYGDEIVKQDSKIETFQKFLVEFVGENINNIEFMLLSEEKMTLKDFIEKSRNTQAIEESIEKSIQVHFGESSEVLSDCYSIGSTEMSLCIKIGSILNIAEKNIFGEHYEKLYCENSPIPNQAQLTNIYRIVSFLYSDFGIKSELQTILNFVGNGIITPEDISSRIDTIYKVIWKTINKNQITNKGEFQKVIMTFLSEGDITLLQNFQAKISNNTIEAENKYDREVFGKLTDTISTQEKDEIVYSIQEFIGLFSANFRPKDISSMGNNSHGIGSGQNAKAIKNLFEAIQKGNETNDEYLGRIQEGSWKEIIGESDSHNLKGKIVTRLGEKRRLFFDNLSYLGNMIEDLNEGQFTDLSDLSEIYKENLDSALEETFGIES